MLKRDRWLIAALLLAMVAGIVFAESPLLWSAVTFVIAAAAAYEWARLLFAGRARHLAFTAFFCFLVFLGEVWLFRDAATHQSLWSAAAVFWAFAAPCFLLTRRAPPAVLCGALGMTLIYAAWHAANLLYAEDVALLVAGMAAVWLFDSAAFFIGRLAGRTALAPAISPKKTLEGLAGGVFAVLIFACVYHARAGGQDLPLVVFLTAVFALVTLATLGDLFESLMKRRGGVKDSGTLLGGHGGVLDRLDAMIPALPFVALLSPWLN